MEAGLKFSFSVDIFRTSNENREERRRFSGFFRFPIGNLRYRKTLLLPAPSDIRAVSFSGGMHSRNVRPRARARARPRRIHRRQRRGGKPVVFYPNLLSVQLNFTLWYPTESGPLCETRDPNYSLSLLSEIRAANSFHRCCATRRRDIREAPPRVRQIGEE